MSLIRGGPAGPDGLGGAYANGVESDRAALWSSLGGRQGVLRGFVHSGVSGQMALSFTPGAALVDERDAAGNSGTLFRGYHVWNDVATVVQFGPASVSARKDAVVAAFVDTEDGPVGTGGLDVGPHLVVVPGVSGTTTPRTDAQITAWLGRGGWVRLMDVPIASTDTEINLANIVVTDSRLTRLTQTGEELVDIVTAGTSAVKAVVFPRPFAKPPVVQLTADTTTNNAPCVATDRTTTGFNIRAARLSGTLDVLVLWTAVGPE